MDWVWHNYNRDKKYYQMARQEHGELQLECYRKPRDHNEPKHDGNSCTSFPRIFVSYYIDLNVYENC